MRIILDTNVLVAALISRHGAPDTIYRAWRAGRFELITSSAQLDEFRRISRYPKLRAILRPHLIGTMVNNLNRALIIEKLPALPDNMDLGDPGDAFLLAMAAASGADYLVTGDYRAGLLQKGNVGRTRIVNPASFCEETALEQ
ncbi:MAG TPA: putative toxin-antitoxin system toxin component, PIN family [Sphingomonas sp.]|nr:putative toxin-antitoxin system toxin component, PIN family [Sphingomonas sp.]